jgi:hypothetical protein
MARLNLPRDLFTFSTRVAMAKAMRRMWERKRMTKIRVTPHPK